MVREAIKVEGTGKLLRRFTVANVVPITKHTLMTLVADNTASSSTTTSSAAEFAGIAIFEKEASDGQTEMTCDIGGVWDLTASGAIVRGHKVILANGANYVQSQVVTGISLASGGIVVGTATETASDAEVVRVDLDKI